MKIITELGMEYATPSSKIKSRFIIVECEKCNNNFRTMFYNAKRKKNIYCKTCACKKHGLSGHKLYPTWLQQKARIKNSKTYVEKNIIFEEKFKDFTVWVKYVESLNNSYKDNYTIDRINNNIGYIEGNLRWTTKTIQARNTKIISKNNTTGYRGVEDIGKKYRARICVNYKTIHIGVFKTKKEAAIAFNEYIINNNLEHTKNIIKKD